MISADHKIIFVHLRRTGGNSVEHALGGITLLDADKTETNVWDNNLHRGNVALKIDRRGHYIHASAGQIQKLHPVEFDSYLKFTIIRNPWEQVASLYLRLHSDDSAFVGFDAWLNKKRKDRDFWIGTVPSYSLHDDNGVLLVNKILRFESLENDFISMCKECGISTKPLWRFNGNGMLDYRRFFRKTSIDIVSDIYIYDIEKYGYGFE